MNSCSSDNATETTTSNTSSSEVQMFYTYNLTEIETMDLINAYRIGIGLD